MKGIDPNLKSLWTTRLAVKLTVSSCIIRGYINEDGLSLQRRATLNKMHRDKRLYRPRWCVVQIRALYKETVMCSIPTLVYSASTICKFVKQWHMCRQITHCISHTNTVLWTCPTKPYPEYVRLHESLPQVKPRNVTRHTRHSCFPHVHNIIILPVAMSQ